MLFLRFLLSSSLLFFQCCWAGLLGAFGAGFQLNSSESGRFRQTGLIKALGYGLDTRGRIFPSLFSFFSFWQDRCNRDIFGWSYLRTGGVPAHRGPYKHIRGALLDIHCHFYSPFDCFLTTY
jgi:hypothetical protein